MATMFKQCQKCHRILSVLKQSDFCPDCEKICTIRTCDNPRFENYIMCKSHVEETLKQHEQDLRRFLKTSNVPVASVIPTPPPAGDNTFTTIREYYDPIGGPTRVETKTVLFGQPVFLPTADPQFQIRRYRSPYK